METWQADGMARLGGGVLVVSAGGAALAAQSATSTTQAPSGGGAVGKADKARAGALGRGFGFRHGLGRRVLHGEVTVQTQEGVKTLVMASGEVSALSKDAITVKSSTGSRPASPSTATPATGSATESRPERRAQGRRHRLRDRREVGQRGHR